MGDFPHNKQKAKSLNRNEHFLPIIKKNSSSNVRGSQTAARSPAVSEEVNKEVFASVVDYCKTLQLRVKVFKLLFLISLICKQIKILFYRNWNY